MIPKAEEDKWRLIAILATPYRIWARRAGEMVSIWAEQMANYGASWIGYGPGKSSEAVVYMASLIAEGGGGRNDDVTVTVISDLEKGFEKILHSKLVAAAKVYDFPEMVLNLALDMYRAERRIRCGAAFSRSVRTNMGVLAGCPIAMGLLLLATMDPMERFMTSIPKHLNLAMVYVDDFNLTFAFDGGRRRWSAEYMAFQVDITYRRLQSELEEAGLFISIDKNKIVSNDDEVLDKIEKKMTYAKPTADSLTHKQVVKLGVDYAAGRPIKYKRADERLKKATIKTKALLGYCKKGWRTTNIVKAHVMGATMYGARIMGVKPQHLAKIRALIRSTTSSTIGGSSATAVMSLQKSRLLDPAYTAIGLPVLEWAMRVNKAHYEEDARAKQLHKNAWEAQQRIIFTADDPWQHVCGPASAVMATLRGINWVPRAYYEWETDDGRRINLHEQIPYFVRHVLNESITRQLWSTTTMYNNDTQKVGNKELDRPFWAPMRKVIFGNDPELGGATRSVAVNNQWCQKRVEAAGYVDKGDVLCQACEKVPGTLTHRHHPKGCEHYANLRKDNLSEEAAAFGEQLGSTMLYEHGLVMMRDHPPYYQAEHRRMISGFSSVTNPSCLWLTPILMGQMSQCNVLQRWGALGTPSLLWAKDTMTLMRMSTRNLTLSTW